MNLRTFLISAAVLALGYALGLILMPAFMNTMYCFGTSRAEILLSRFFGVELLVLGLIAWLAKDFTGASVRPVTTGSLIRKCRWVHLCPYGNAWRSDEFNWLVGVRNLFSSYAWVCLFSIHGAR